MKEVTMEKVLEIFADYLEQSDDVEIVETSKMGVFSVYDGSRELDRSMLSIQEIPDAEALARQLIWLETSKYFYSSNHRNKDPWECDEAFINEVYYRVLPRLAKLPPEWHDEVDRFFSNPEIETEW